MMKLTVSNVGPIERAEIEIGAGITLIGAPNEAGKSTLLATAAGLLIGQPFFAGVTTKKESDMLVRAGAKAGSAMLASDDGQVSAAYPGGELKSTGQPPTARPNAVGRAPFLALSDKDRAKVLCAILKAEPSKDDLAAALRADGFAEEDIGDVTEILAGHGWEGGYAFVDKEWTEAKGGWRQITKENYGSAKAGAWLPQGWSDDLAAAAVEALAVEVGKTKTDLEHRRADQAVDQADIARLTEIAGSLRDRQAIADKKAQEAQRAFNEIAAAETERAAMPAASENAGIPCPHCQEPVVVRPVHGGSYTLHKAEKISEKELHDRRLAFAGIDGRISRLKAEHGTANKAVIEAQAAVREAEEAGKKLGEQKGKKKGDQAADGQALAKAEAAHQKAEQRLQLKQLKDSADAKHAHIAQLEKVRAHFAPHGLRQQKLATVLSTFCEGPLRDLSDAAEWKPITIRPDMSVASGGMLIMSKSAQWRAEAVIAVAFAKLTAAPLVILDEADMNDLPHREGLVNLLDHAGLPALVGMTVSKSNALPPLEAAGLGCCYWIENGVAQRVGIQQKAAA